MTCRHYHKYNGGGKSERITSMLNSQRSETFKKEVAAIVEKHKLNDERINVRRLQTEAQRAEKAYEQHCKELRVSDNDSYGQGKITWKPHYDNCYLTEAETRDLQRASDLYTLGKYKEARAIWDDIIAKNKLGA